MSDCGRNNPLKKIDQVVRFYKNPQIHHINLILSNITLCDVQGKRAYLNFCARMTQYREKQIYEFESTSSRLLAEKNPFTFMNVLLVRDNFESHVLNNSL